MLRALLLLLLLFPVACVSKTAPQQLRDDCQAEATAEQLLTDSWLQQRAVWRLRQTALLELGPKKLPLEGFLRLDLQKRQARLVAMNEIGLVLFDLQVGEREQQLQRAIPQLQQIDGFAVGVAQSLRQIFLQPRPQQNDHLQNRGNSQRLWRPQPGGSLGFIFDCQRNLREARQLAEAGDWQIYYDEYADFAGQRLPQQIVLNDFRHGVKLSLWLGEVKLEP